jgi:hypothetical protein
MPKRTQRRKIVGYAVFINQTGEKNGWERISTLLNNKGEARTELDACKIPYKSARIQAVRTDTKPFVPDDGGNDGHSLTRREKQAQYLASQRRRAA